MVTGHSVKNRKALRKWILKVAIPQSQNSFVIPNATPFIEFDLNVLATGHVGPTIRIFDVTQPLRFAVFNRVQGRLCLKKSEKTLIETTSIFLKIL